jgi:hypothetical protein
MTSSGSAARNSEMLALYQARGIRGAELNPIESISRESDRSWSLNQNRSDWHDFFGRNVSHREGFSIRRSAFAQLWEGSRARAVAELQQKIGGLRIFEGKMERAKGFEATR